MTSKKTMRIILAAVMAALCFVSTKIIQIPTPSGGYIHLGDGFVLITGIVLGPVYGALAAGIGSMLTDLLSGYAQYSLATFVIKGSVAMIAGIIAKHLIQKRRGTIITSVLAGIIGMMLVISGYWAFEAFVLGAGWAAALTGVPTNAIQGIFGIIVSVTFVPAFDKINVVKELRFGESSNEKSNISKE